MIFLFLACTSYSTIDELNTAIDERYSKLCSCLSEISSTNEQETASKRQKCYSKYELNTDFRLSIENAIELTADEKKMVYMKINKLHKQSCPSAKAANPESKSLEQDKTEEKPAE